MQHRVVVERVRKRLIEAAKKREMVAYEDLLADKSYGVVAEPGEINEIGSVLREISSEEVLIGNPPLSALCVRKKEGTPGREFRSFLDPAEQLNEEQRKAIWQFMRDAVFDHYDRNKQKGESR